MSDPKKEDTEKGKRSFQHFGVTPKKKKGGFEFCLFPNTFIWLINISGRRGETNNDDDLWACFTPRAASFAGTEGPSGRGGPQVGLRWAQAVVSPERPINN